MYEKFKVIVYDPQTNKDYYYDYVGDGGSLDACKLGVESHRAFVGDLSKGYYVEAFKIGE